MKCFDFPGGIGTASRRVGEHHVGVLLLCNFGDREYLDLLGTHARPARGAARRPHGSCIAVCATDAPLGPHQLRRLALRPLLGLARVGSYGSEGSGEIGLAFSTGDAPATLANDELDPFFAAAYEAAHEAVYNCLVAARPARALDGTMQDAFPVELRPRAGGAARADDRPRATRSLELAQALIRDRHLEPARQRDAGGRAPRRLPARGRGRCELVGPDPERLNLVARIEGGDGPSLMLIGHTDVVPAPPDDWTVDRSRASSATGSWSAAAPPT